MNGLGVQGCWEAFCGTGRGLLPSACIGSKSPNFLRLSAGPKLCQYRSKPAAQLLPIRPGLHFLAKSFLLLP